MRLESKKTIYKIYALLALLISNMNSDHHLMYQEVMDELDIGSRNTVSNYLYFIRDVLGIPVKSSGGNFGGIWISEDWDYSARSLNIEEFVVVVKSVNRCNKDDERNILMRLVNRNMLFK